MQKSLIIIVFSTAVVFAQTPDITGVWKADLSKSKLAGPPGPPPTNYLVMITQKPAE
jgi:hypothetical protein